MAKTKRLLSLLLAVAMVLSLMPAIAFAAETTSYNDCICGSNTGKHLPGCDGTAQEWTETTTLPTKTGYYRLTGEVTVSSTAVIESDAKVVLDLNGQTIKASVIAFNLAKGYAAELTILDSKGTGKLISTVAGGAGLAALANNTGKKVLTIYGGTFDASGVKAGTNNGLLIRDTITSNADSMVNIHGGTFIGGTISTAAKHGAAIYSYNLTMTGGTIYGGTAAGYAGAVYSVGTFKMSGGLISGGRSKTNGGAVYSIGTMEMSGGTITGGSAATNGGNLCATGTLTITGDAKIYGGLTDAGTEVSAPNIRLGASTKLTIAIDGDGYIGGNRFGTNGISNGSTANTHIACECGSQTGTHAGTCPGVKHTNWYGWTSNTALPRDKTLIENGHYYLTKDVTLANGREIFGTVCLDLNGYDVTVTGTSNATRVFNISEASSESCKGANLSLSDSSGESVIDLGSHDTMGSLLSLNATDAVVNIYGGKVDGSKLSGASMGAVIRNTKLGTINIYGGEIIGGSVTSAGGVVYNSGNMTIAGGKIHSGKAGAAGTGMGGNIYTNGGVITMTGGEIFDGSANKGANVYVDTAATFNMEGGQVYITGGGEGVYPPVHTACICGSTDGQHKDGCDQTVWSDWKVLTSGSALPATGGKYFLADDITITGMATVTTSGNINIDLNGHTIYFESSKRLYTLATSGTSGVITVSDSVGTGGIVFGTESTKTTHGALVSFNADEGLAWTLRLYGGTFDGRNARSTGGNYGAVVYVNSPSCSAYIYDGVTIIGSAGTTDDTITLGGGAVGINRGYLEMNGGTIRDGIVKDSGGNVRIGGGGTFVMNAGTISGGKANKGGNVYLAQGAGFEKNGGTISGDTSVIPNNREDGTVYEEFKVKITWLNEDGTLFLEEQRAYYSTGSNPETLPTKEGDAHYSYVFAGWDKELPEKFIEDMTFTAVFTPVVNKYTVTWVDEDGTELEVDTDVEYGTTPEFNGTEPTKEGNAQYTYTFAGWAPTVDAVTGDVTYTATYTETVNEYTVNWVVGSGTVTETYKYGETPVFTGSTDKAADDNYTYEFIGWDAELAPVTGNMTYTAQYQKTEIEQEHTCSYSYVDNGDGTHDYVCECGDVQIDNAAHTYDKTASDMTCNDCGHVATSRIRAKSGNLLYKDMIKVQIEFEMGGIVAQKYGMLVFASAEDAATLNMELAVQHKELYKNGTYYYGDTDGISARLMGETMYYVGYADLGNGVYEYTATVAYGPRNYAVNMLKKSTTSDETRNLISALMHYGAAAQQYAAGGTLAAEELMNYGIEGIVEIPYDEAVLGENLFSVDTTVTNGFRTRSANMLFSGAITYEIQYSVETALESKELFMEYTIKGETKSVAMERINTSSGVRYVAKADGNAAKDMDELIVARPYYVNENGEKVYGAELRYSGYEYTRRTVSGTSASENGKALAKAFAMYVHYADATLGK